MANNINQDLELFNELVAVFLEDEIQNPVTKQITPHEVKNLLDIKLEKEGTAGDEFKKTLKEIVLNSPKSASKLFFNQLFGGRHSKAVLGDLLAVLLNNSMATYKIAGPQVVIEQEILFYLERLDINEEVIRLKNHISLFKKTLSSKKPIGKKLNFISQEIGREINTIGSKCSNFQIQKSVINMKEHLEKIKEENYNVL